MTDRPQSAEQKLCDCELHCVLHVYADLMLKMLYQYAGECAHCEGTGEVVVSSVQRDVDWWDETKGPCSACADIRALIKQVDPCGNYLTRAEPAPTAPPAPIATSTSPDYDDDIPF